MARKGRGAKRKKGKRSPGTALADPTVPAAPSSSVTRSQPADSENTLVQLSELEQGFSETDVPLPTNYSDRQLWRTVMRRLNQNQIEVAATVREERRLREEQAVQKRSESGAAATTDRALDAALREGEMTLGAMIRDADQRRDLEIRTTETVTDREQDRLDRAEDRKDRAEDRNDTSAKSEFWREIVVMALSVGTFLLAGLLVLVGISGEHSVAYVFSALSALCSAGGLRSLFVAHKRRADREHEAEGEGDSGGSD